MKFRIIIIIYKLILGNVEKYYLQTKRKDQSVKFIQH